MKLFPTICALLFTVVQLSAQRSNDAILEDSVFSWQPFTPLKPFNYPWKISTAKQKLPYLFYDWIKKSHYLVGALSQSFGIAEPNKKNEVSIYSIGTFAGTYVAEWNNSKTKVIKQPHSENPIQILTNYLIDAQQIPMLTKEGSPVFIRRNADPNETFKGWKYGSELVKKFNLENHSQLSKYIIQYYGCEGESCQPLVAVYLVPGNKLPIRQLTRGEVLQLCEEAIPSESEKARKKIIAENSYRKDAQEKWLKHFEDETKPKWKANIAKLRQQYGNSLDNPASISNINGIEMINVFNGNDLFSESANTRMFGIYTYETGVLEKSKEDPPLWICISWQPANDDQPVYARELHRSMIKHFNFDYVYNYFFASKKLKGQPYTILNSGEQKRYLAAIKDNKPTSIITSNTSSGIYLFDDFANNAIGSKPKGWYMPNIGKPSLVAQPDNLAGNWIQMGDYRLTPYNLKKNLPENFKMEFDVASNDFTGNAGASLLLKINNSVMTKNGDYKNAANPVDIDLDIKAGNAKFIQNPSGYVRLKVTYKGMSSSLRYADVLQYSNEFSNKTNVAKIVIIKSGNKITGTINGKEIIAIDKYGSSIPGFNEIPEGTIFTNFYFQKTTPDKTIYISNIKIIDLNP